MAVEIERRGVPVAMISALPPVALELGANRVIRGVKIPHPCGEERDVREEIVRRALQALSTPVSQPTIF
jgi:betaine reductase